MHNVPIPEHLQRDMIVEGYSTEGYWDNEGNWVEGTKMPDRNIRGALFSFNPKDFLNYPEGFIMNDDRKLITTEVLKDSDKIVLEGKKFIVKTLQNYDYLADVKFYVFRRGINDTGNNQKTD